MVTVRPWIYLRSPIGFGLSRIVAVSLGWTVTSSSWVRIADPGMIVCSGAIVAIVVASDVGDDTHPMEAATSKITVKTVKGLMP